MLANVYEYCIYSFHPHTNRNANNILHSQFSPPPFVPFPFQKSKTLYVPVFLCILLLLLCAISSLVITRFVSVDEGVLQRKASKSHQLLRLIFPAPR